MKQLAIDAVTGRLVGEPEPDFDYYVNQINKHTTVSQIQKKFKLSYRDANEVMTRFKQKDVL